MQRTHTLLSVWFWTAYLVASQTPGISAVQFQWQLGLSCYETAFHILHKLRVGMARVRTELVGSPEKSSRPMNLRGRSYAWQGERCQRYGVRGWSHVEVRQRKQQGSRNKRRAGRYAGRVRLAVAPQIVAPNRWAAHKVV